MGYRHSREDILAAALGLALDEGLSQLSFGRVARRLGINDRTIVYYFPTKDVLIESVLVAMGNGLQDELGRAFVSTAAGHRELIARAWPVLCTPDARRVFALFFEANGLAAVGRSPYDSVVPLLVNAWIEWLSGFVEGNDDVRHREATAAIAVIDGLLLLRQVAGDRAAEEAAAALGIA